MTLCTDLLRVNHYEHQTTIEPLWCKCWSCELCAPRRRSRLIRDVIDGKPTKFLTLTTGPEVTGTPERKAEKLVDAWRALRKRIRLELSMPEHERWRTPSGIARHRRLRRHERSYIGGTPPKLPPLPFFAVFEATKKGQPHLHIVLRAPFMPQKWLSAQMLELLKSPILDVRAIDSTTRVAAYIAKYLGKDPHQFGTCKRYWHSKDWNVTPEPEAPESSKRFLYSDRIRAPWHDVLRRLQESGRPHRVVDWRIYLPPADDPPRAPEHRA